MKLPATGLFGGGPGSCSELLIRPNGETEFRRFDEVFGVASPTKFTNVVLRAGDELSYRTPGGAGFGDPRARAPEQIERDVREGYVSGAAARDTYGWTEKDS